MTTEPVNTPSVVFVKYETDEGTLKIARHIRPAIVNPTEELSDFIHDLVRTYKSNRNMTYLGLADEDEFEAFQRLHSDEPS